MTIDAVRAGARVAEIELDLSHRATGRTRRRIRPSRAPARRLRARIRPAQIGCARRSA